MRSAKAWLVFGAVLMAAQAFPSTVANAGEGGWMIRLVDHNGADGGDTNVDLAVRQVTVQPVRAHVGEVVHVEVVIENRFEGRATTPAKLYANGKEVGYRLFTWGIGGDRLHRLGFDWNTGGMPPGEYRIRAEAFVFEDSSPFDNDLAVNQPVVLAAPGSGFPGGEKAGGSYTETDPRFRKASAY